MSDADSRKHQDLEQGREASLSTRTGLKLAATRDIAGALNAVLADLFAIYFKPGAAPC